MAYIRSCHSQSECPSSDVDILLGKMPSRELGNIHDLVSRLKPLKDWLAAAGLSNEKINFVEGPNHWALTGREERQFVNISGPRPMFIPAPINAESSMIRRAAMKIMGISLCEEGPPVDTNHSLRQLPATMNAIQWVSARAIAWEDETLRDLVYRIKNALAIKADVREAL